MRETVQNATLGKLEEIIHENSLLPEKSAKLLEQPFNEVQDNLEKHHNDTLKNINELFDITVTLTESFSTNYDKIRAEIQGLGKLEQVMVQTADAVLDTKRRVEYGVHQILAEVAKQIKDSSKDINQGINERQV
ncbi:hypothetical protein NQ314_003792 [Rhamnusium bicolor]|uniref:Uncharacterized protein n=1 Tax=Rhamnusium bicolor TaxID=1586634 RepID=A0AAV8ZNI8_9CUCU|nr:hypothetical protein NQ314_003792 [Rhamnusium bicolor]